VIQVHIHLSIFPAPTQLKLEIVAPGVIIEVCWNAGIMLVQRYVPKDFIRASSELVIYYLAAK
jgi:predicted thioesterase